LVNGLRGAKKHNARHLFEKKLKKGGRDLLLGEPSAIGDFKRKKVSKKKVPSTIIHT